MDETIARRIHRVNQACSENESDLLAVELPLTIESEGRTILHTQCSPGMVGELVVGALYTEGIINLSSDIRGVIIDRGEHDLRARVGLSPSSNRLLDIRAKKPDADIIGLVRPHRQPPPEARFTPSMLNTMMRTMEGKQSVFPQTGATHSAALFDAHGFMLAHAEDLGRHNALDKAFGAVFAAGDTHKASVAMVTSRISYEVCRKAVSARLRCLAGISAATSMAVDWAERHDLTLVGRLRGGRMNVYCHPERIRLKDDSQDAWENGVA
ncbi:formate dehydrogenase accessory sulfurtransferase FdhD [Oceanidesulfovibrio marinus]|uniref:Protein FdhD n=1 Tax=Oceanidesulfovibrio marinus TaxID=370038 RepID=A0A6P1ZD38_9BACT|nr:formate dehydrogenase accessory sulfurtransferase FdhD [Oceanidesulfovibrio marinus]QJT10306.1 formate dehydrogenase accessory sulfurtransferase FdhD [Oceanidesulfovibrio marinus]TVM32256.1 formate dehydrogenase accessory sulfurtransferase FdhD [Oceanidesulfovibrio marinus]